MSHPDLTPDQRARLMAAPVDPSDTTAPPIAAPPEPAAPVGRKARLKATVRAKAAPAVDPALDRLAGIVATRLRHVMRSEYDELAAEVHRLRAEQDALRATTSEAQLFRSAGALQRLDAAEINAELMKGELAAFRLTLDGFGHSIAPAAGLPGVAARFAELREQVNALDRQLRAAARPTIGEPDAVRAESPSPTSPANSPTAPPTSGFDYVGFERRFRGDSETVLATLADRYDALLRDHQPVLDFGCGRGELVGALHERGIVAEGVDPDPGMVEEAQGHGRAVHRGDGIEYLRAQPVGSLGSVISVHVVEHLVLDQLVELLELAATRLRPGGVFVAETPNPSSLIVLGNSYILDPTHVWPLHPSLMVFLAERAGFRDAQIRFYSPAEDYHLAPIDAGPDAPEWVAQINTALERLNHVLFGPQEYALVATTPPSASGDSAP